MTVEIPFYYEKNENIMTKGHAKINCMAFLA